MFRKLQFVSEPVSAREMKPASIDNQEGVELPAVSYDSAGTWNGSADDVEIRPKNPRQEVDDAQLQRISEKM